MVEDRFKHYKTGVPHMDEEHLSHLKLMEEIDIISQTALDQALQKIDELIKMMEHHWEEEDLEMVNLNYPYIEYHALDHKNMIKDIYKFRENYGMGSRQDKFNALRLTDIFLNHIDTYDIQYAQWYLKNIKK